MLRLKPFRILRILSLALAALFVAGVLGFRLIEGWSWLDSVYMVVTTLTTVGYREVHELSEAGRIFNIFLIASGVGLAFAAIGTFSTALLEFELGRFLGRRRMEREIGRLSGHYIICGAGRVGRSVARELVAQPVPFVVVENSEAKAERAADWPTLVGDATKEEVLREARIEHARGLVAATTTDATNIYIVLTARSLNPKLKIIARASEEGSEKHLVTAGADSVISPYVFAGHRIAQTFLRPGVLDFLDIAIGRDETKLQVEIEELSVGAGSSLAGSTIGESRIHQKMGVIILAIKRPGEAMRVNPTATDVIQGGDSLIVVGETANLKQLEHVALAQGRGVTH
ncbi:MAG TPA: potassium channel protein [Terriglobales bacterium]|nr:potassium channel protein [Terriglobales bacterium]